MARRKSPERGGGARKSGGFLEAEDAAPIRRARRSSSWSLPEEGDRKARHRGMAESAGPIFYRKQHGALSDDSGPVVERFARQLPDSDGRPGHPHRVHDTLAVLHRRGSIDGDALEAGRRFEEDFARAGLNTLHARDLSRLSGGGGQDLNEVMLAGRERVARALKALGGHASPGGAAIWSVLGEGRTIKEFARSSQFGAGRSLDEKVAKGIVITALATLAAHYGFSR